MSIFYNIGRNPNPDYVEIDCEFIVLKNLKAIISQKIGVAENDMRVKHYAPYQYIKKGSSVSIQITVKNYVDEPIKFHQIVSNQRLQSMMSDCRFYIAKSSNQDNIQKARDCSVWATTFPNQNKFRTAFQCFKHVFIIFGTNRSYQLKGLARMESQPDKMPDKSIWSGVGNIRLGGNFKLRWIRKKPLSLTTIQKKLGIQAKDQMLKATDGYQPDPQIAKKVALLFQLPLQPYYKMADLVLIKKEQKLQRLYSGQSNRNSSFINAHLATLMLKNIQESANIDQLGIVEQHFQIPKMELLKKITKKEKKKSKKKIKKEKRRKRKESSSSSYSSSSSNSRSRSRSRSSSSSSSNKSAKRQKVSATQRPNKL